MLERFIKLYDDVRLATLDLTGKWPFNQKDLEKMQDIWNSLKPIEVGIKTLGGKNVNLMDAEKIYAKVKHHLMAIGTPVALKLRDAFIKRIKERRNHTLIHLMYFLRIPNYWNFEKDRFDIPIIKEDIIKLATSLIGRLFPNDVRNPTLENDSQEDFFESSEKDLNQKSTCSFEEDIYLGLDEDSNTGQEILEQKLPLVSDEMVKWASNPGGLRPVVLTKLHYALKSIQPSSVESERCFSTCGIYDTKIRSQLGDETLSALLFLNKQFKKSVQKGSRLEKLD
jgi:hypothetical protein